MPPPRRRSLARAALQPLNLLVLAALLVLAFVVAPWIALLAVPVYGVLVVAAARPPELPPGDRLAGVGAELRPRVARVLAEQDAIQRQLDALPVQPAGVPEQVQALCQELVEAARRASDVDAYLSGVDVQALRRRIGQQRGDPTAASDALWDQLEAVEALIARRRALDDELDHVESALGAIRARLASAQLATGDAGRLRADVDELRDTVNALAGGLREAYERGGLGRGAGGLD